MVESRHRVVGPIQQLVHGRVRRGPPGFQAGEFVQHPHHHSVKAIELLRKLLHGHRHLCLELVRPPQRRQIDEAREGKNFP